MSKEENVQCSAGNVKAEPVEEKNTHTVHGYRLVSDFETSWLGRFSYLNEPVDYSYIVDSFSLRSLLPESSRQPGAIGKFEISVRFIPDVNAPGGRCACYFEFEEQHNSSGQERWIYAHLGCCELPPNFESSSEEIPAATHNVCPITDAGQAQETESQCRRLPFNTRP